MQRCGQWLLTTAVMVLVLAPVLVCAYPMPLSFFKFNEAEDVNQSLVTNYGYHGGQGAGYWLSMYTNWASTYSASNDVACNCLSEDGQGTSGQLGDRALRLPVPDMGADGATGLVKWARAQLTEGETAYNSLSGMTVVVWFKAFVPLKKDPALVWKLGNGLYAWSIEGNTGIVPADGVPLRFIAGNQTVWASADGTGTGTSDFKETNEWVFLAVTYDGSQAADNVRWYKGGTGLKTTEFVRANTVAAGNTGNGAGQLSIGGRVGTSQDRPFFGLIDNVRGFASKTDATVPVLTQDELEGLRLTDAVPEPAAMVGAMLVVLLAIPRHARARFFAMR